MFAVPEGNGFVFFDRNPGYEGCARPVEEGVVLYIPPDVSNWPVGEKPPQTSLGRSKKNPKLFKVFKYPEDCRQSEYSIIPGVGTPRVFEKWSDFLLQKIQMELMPEHAKECIAINLATEDYVLGKSPHEVHEVAYKRWRNQPTHCSHVDGSPLIKMRTPFRIGM